MKRYYLILCICISVIAAVFVAGSFVVYNNYKEGMNMPRVYEHEALDYKPDEDIELAVLFSGEEGSPYDVEGVLGFFNGYDQSNANLKLKIINVNILDAQLISVHNEDNSKIFPISENNLLEITQEPNYIEYDIANVSKSFIDDITDMYLSYMYYDGIIHTVKIVPYTLHENDVFNSTDIRITNNMDDFDFIVISNDIVSFVGDNIIIEKPLFIPSNLRVEIKPNQKFDIINDAYIVSYSSINCIGTQDNPIEFYTSDGTGRGLFICKASQRSRLENTNFTGLDTPKSGMWSLTGSVTFYEADVDIIDCTFLENTCEDGLNIIRSDFYISGTEFMNIYSDAFDADFSIGEITDSYFNITGNDGIDVSTSDVIIRDVKMVNIGDKAVSGGENSTIEIDNIQIDNAIVGIASKDMSHISINDISIKDTMVGMTLYQKKPEFGPSYINAQNVEMIGEVSIDYLIEKNSQIFVDNNEILPRSETKEGILFDKMKNGEPLG